MNELLQYSAIALAKALQSKQISAVDVLDACFKWIDQLDHRLKAFITLCPERAYAEAQRADEAIVHGQLLGPLHGIPIAIKDLTLTAGVRTTYGSPIYKEHVPTQDELCVARLRAAGGIVIGKTNTPEFGLGDATTNPLLGPTANPYDLDKTCGNSSGGSAVAVATGMCPLAQGTDMGGSVRMPASFCGIVGLRPSIGRIPRVPKPLLWDTLVSDGIFARTVEDAAFMLSVMAGYDARDPVAIAQSSWSAPDFSDHSLQQMRQRIRVAYSHDLGVAPVADDVVAIVEAAVAQMQSVCQSITIDQPDCSAAPQAFEVLRAAVLLHSHKHHLEHHDDQIADNFRWNVERGLGISAADFLQAESDRSQLYLNFLEFFERYDVLVTPCSSVLPFPHTQHEILEINGKPLRNIIDYLAITYIISLTGLPTLSIPCGWTPSGLPVGMQLVGKPHGEAELLQFAYLLQQDLGFCHHWPPEFSLALK
ncbi:MAG TPA: amidase [Crinalium sp.]|jgi:amidase